MSSLLISVKFRKRIRASDSADPLELPSLEVLDTETACQVACKRPSRAVVPVSSTLVPAVFSVPNRSFAIASCTSSIVRAAV
ncbi:uncharacterized protein [Physcomitrium patens]|uniref:uncharacterized protein isoform X1 n=1 Tax=Physcomitrium patens TaxID=3218 RepID=UPI003CCC9587